MSKTKTNEEEMQQKYLQFQLIQQQLEQVNEHLQMLNQQTAELDISVNAVAELSQTEVNNEILAPIANGIFLKAKLTDNKKFIVNVGSDTTVEKTIPEVIKLLEEQKQQVYQQLVEADAIMQELTSQAQIIYQEIEKEQ